MSNGTRTLTICTIASVLTMLAVFSPFASSSSPPTRARALATTQDTRTDLLEEVRLKLAEIKTSAVRAKAATRSTRVVESLDRVWTLADEIERSLTVRPPDPPPVDPPPTRPPPTRPPPVDPPPTRPPPTNVGFAPEQFWEHSAYMDAIGNLTMRDCTFGPDWTTKATTYYSTWDDQSGNFAGKSFSATEWGCWGTTGLAHAVLNLYGPPQTGIAFTDCAWLAAPDPADGSPSTMRWGVRGFGMMDVLFDRCSFSRGMGAGTQVALRASAAHGDIFPRGVHRYEGCTYIGIGDPKSERWGAFTLSEHAPEGYGVDTVPVDVEIIECVLIGGHLNWTDPNGKIIRSPRGIMANGRQRVVIRGLYMDYPAPHDGWAVQIWNADDGNPSTVDVVIEDSFIREGRIELRNCGSVSVSGGSGDAYLAIGTHSNPDKPFPMENLVYQGPLAQGYKSPVVK
jgi:hypothetical protein